MMAKGCIGAMNTASEVFLILTTQLYYYYAIIMQTFPYILTRGETGIQEYS